MSLFAWIRSLLGGARTRHIARLQPGVGPTVDVSDDAVEHVAVSGGPLKPGHRRRALRDPRLLPKVKSPIRQLGLAKRRKVMTADEADRLFAGTLRTRNRQLRDLLTDEEQLARWQLPVWKTEQDLAQALSISMRELRFFSIHREREQQPHYVTFAIPKRSGGRRLIMAPKRRLKRIQRLLLQQLVERLPVSEHAHAFRRGRSIRTGAEPHVGKPVLLHLDLKDFFPSVTFARVRGLLIAYGYSYPVASILAVLMTEAERQPVAIEGMVFHVPVGPRHCVQGAPTSPGICNALLLRLDHRLAGYARKQGLTYTRYADDLTFSGAGDRVTAQRWRTVLTHIVESEGFTVNQEKTKLMTQGSRQVVTGVVVNQTLGLSRQERRRLRAALHQAKRPGTSDVANALAGKLAYLHMLNPAQAVALTTER